VSRSTYHRHKSFRDAVLSSTVMTVDHSDSDSDVGDTGIDAEGSGYRMDVDDTAGLGTSDPEMESQTPTEV
jgi:hypothetical protein